MEVLTSFGHFVFLTQVYFTVSQDMITIIRNPGDGDHWTDVDQFKLPDSKCSSSSSSTYCTNWKALPLDSQPCHCECSDFKKATFGFYSGSWTCLANTEVRKQTGNCKYKFQSELDGYPIRILDQSTHYNVILPSSGCSVDQTKSRYFKCDGSSAGIDSQSFSQWFSIQYRGLFSPNGHTYNVTIGTRISAHLLGRIISLNIICQQENSCLLFKLKGTFQCAENVISITTSPSSAIPITNVSVVIPATAKTLAPNFQTTAKPNFDAKASGVSSTVVSVVVTLAIIVVIVIVIVAYVYLKRKRGESVWLVDYISSSVRKFRSTQPAKKKTVDEIQKDPVYAEIPEEQRKNEPPVDQAGGIYNYAFDDPRTAYIASQSAQYNKLVHNREGPNQTAYTEPKPASYNRLVHNREGSDQKAYTEPQPASYNRLVHNREGHDQTAYTEPQPASYNRLVHNREGPDQTAYTEPQPASYNRLVHNREGPDQTGYTEPQPASYNRLVHNREGHDQTAYTEPQPDSYNRLVHNREEPDQTALEPG
ncbi:uncharacterized protein LOC116287403 isoform X4 [Actinia tenebrosa]|uniref:Uncharacterized protein LOC116287403 isoform X3 n=1 Tax=Actinia tenebrosa TaxID=6105 RepID=A0A6P8H2V4_ACTTE|nr:uncharacterized protein LOC116287403 isoform X3 [Actinia tenebrosa]XP_031549939.1 uncharacterized protein LOC116287403 isoform X4 [Actinia tenebrosa]